MPGRRWQLPTPDELPERPSDPAVRRANFRRIVRLFRPYRARLGLVSSLIVLSAAAYGRWAQPWLAHRITRPGKADDAA